MIAPRWSDGGIYARQPNHNQTSLMKQIAPQKCEECGDGDGDDDDDQIERVIESVEWGF